MCADNPLVAIRVSSPLFVGRSAELERIAAAISGAATGDGQFLLIGGEAGVGKTRLMEEAIGVARSGGALTGVGRCIELTGPSVPLAPVRQLLRELRAGVAFEPGDDSDGGGPFRTLDDLGGRSATGEMVGLGGDTRQARFLEAWLDLLETLGAERSVIVVVEDIHWADRSTLDWLTYVARGRAMTRFTVVATVRTDELHRQHPVQPFLAEIQRLTNVRRLDLERFDRAELAEQIAAISGSPADPRLIDRVYERSNGNAFFTEELVALSGPDAMLPQALLDAVLSRVTRLGSDTEELLRAASAAGNRFSSAMVATVMDIDVVAADRRLRDAVDHQVVVPIHDGGDEFVFRHALVREAIYGDLLPGERNRLHGRFAAAIEAMPGTRSYGNAALAYHWFAAHDLPRAFDASLAAADDAIAMHGYADAQNHYDRAIELWDQVPNAAERAARDFAALLQEAAAVATISDTGRAIALISMAIAAAGDRADPVRLALLKAALGRYAWLEGDGVSALGACREAAELVLDTPPSRDRALVLASLAQVLMVTVYMEDASPVATDVVEIARSIGARDIEAHALTTLGVCTAYLGDVALGTTQLKEALAIAQEIGSVDQVARADANLVDVLTNTGSLREAGDVAAEASAFAEENGLARVLGAIQLAEGGIALYRLGDWTGARALLERAAARRLTGVAQIATEQRLAMIDVGQGRFDDARARLDAVRPMLGRIVEAQFIAPLTEADAELAMWEARPEVARSAIAEMGERLPIERTLYLTRIAPVLALGVRAEADLAALARVRGDAEAATDARRLAERYTNALSNLHESARTTRPQFEAQAAAWLAMGEAELGRLEGASNAASWSAAAAAFAAIPMAYPRAYALWRAGEAILAERGSRTEAAGLLRTAVELATDLDAVPLLAEIRALAMRARIDLAAEGATVPAADRTNGTLGLTRRELEVLRLIADGRSNREIANELFISEGTAGTHVSNILGKLGVRGRTEAAAIAHRLSLVE
jgi:DNA-binding CsgD family transcriptional regulator